MLHQITRILQRHSRTVNISDIYVEDNSVCVRHQSLQQFAVEIFKAKMGDSHASMHYNNLRNGEQISYARPRTEKN